MFQYHPEGYLLRKGKRAGFLCKQKNGYYQVGIGQHRYVVHRIIYAMHHGSIDGTKVIDHIDGDRGNNRIENLREVNMTDNLHNSKVWSTNTSGCTGVSWSTRENKWRAYINFGRRKISLGQFDRKEDAIAARKAIEASRGLYPRNGV